MKPSPSLRPCLYMAVDATMTELGRSAMHAYTTRIASRHRSEICIGALTPVI